MGVATDLGGEQPTEMGTANINVDDNTVTFEFDEPVQVGMIIVETRDGTPAVVEFKNANDEEAAPQLVLFKSNNKSQYIMNNH